MISTCGLAIYKQVAATVALTRGQHLQVCGQAAGIHALLPPLLVECPAKRDVALDCRWGNRRQGGRGSARCAP